MSNTQYPHDYFSKPIDSAQWDALFPKEKSLPQDGTFEIGLTLGGTVSAGAYSAGVVDFLIEALDQWDQYQPESATFQKWQPKLKVLAGTSGGGVIAAMMAKILRFNFPPAVAGALGNKPYQANPLYQVWVEQLNIHDMLDTSDLNNEPITSLLNPKPLDIAAAYIKDYTAQTRLNRRPYLDDTLDVFLTLSNLRGMPYKINMGNNQHQSYLNHADYVYLAFDMTPNQTAPKITRPDVMGVSTNSNNASYITWPKAITYALGTAAFPIGFPLKSLNRPLSHYRYRPLCIPGESTVFQQAPDWELLFKNSPLQIPDTHEFLAADGGMINNEPIHLCRRFLAGEIASNPRAAKEANRAVILIDPFAGAPERGPASFNSLIASTKSLISALRNQVQYDIRDLHLAASETCFSRYMITADRPDKEIGGKSIASASLGAFGGFLCKAYRHHDFMLGRANCQNFLKNTFNVSIDNPLLANQAVHIPAEWIIQDKINGPLIPIIPLCGTAANPQQIEPYPSGAFTVNEHFIQQLNQRVDLLTDKISGNLLPNNIIARILSEIGLHYIKDWEHQKIADKIKQGLREWGL